MIISVMKEPGLFKVLSQCNVFGSYNFFHRSAVVVSESDLVQGWRQSLTSRTDMECGESCGEGGAGGGDDDRENGQQENCADGEGGGGGQETCGDDDSENEEEEEEEETSSDTGLLMEKQYRCRERSRKRRRKQSGDGEPETVAGQIPRDILKRISPLCEKMGLTMREQLFLTLGFCQLCGNTMSNLSIAIDCFIIRRCC